MTRSDVFDKVHSNRSARDRMSRDRGREARGAIAVTEADMMAGH